MLSDEQIKHMVIRFLCWRLPESFNPDGGISFEKTYNENTPWPMTHEPVGTNLFDYTQAEAMVSFMLEGLPVGHQAEAVAPYKFHRFVDGVEMAEDVEINSASSVEEAFRKARAFYGNPKGMDLVLETASSAPAVEPVGIKALEWSESLTAKSIGGTYHVLAGSYLMWMPGGRHDFGFYADDDAAIKAANRNHERFIRSALHPTPTPVSAPVGDLKLSEEDLDTINVCAWNEQTGRVTRYEMRELIRVYRAALRSPAVGEVSPNA